jgi:AraC-like DNA-binding protein
MSSVELPEILRQETGLFDRRFAIGPACWNFTDLLWIHEGEVQLRLGASNLSVELVAPGGILIFPGTAFQGSVRSDRAQASILHFRQIGAVIGEFALPEAGDTIHIQHMIRLSLHYAQIGAAMVKRQRLLQVVLDCLSGSPKEVSAQSRVEIAWQETRTKLAQVRGVADVAAFAGLSESTFRALHRERLKGSAGRYLREMRLRETERLLATTGLGLRELAQIVGYGYPESLSAAFSKSRGQTPGTYRCKQFA